MHHGPAGSPSHGDASHPRCVVPQPSSVVVHSDAQVPESMYVREAPHSGHAEQAFVVHAHRSDHDDVTP